MNKIPKKNDRPGVDRYGRNEFINFVIANNIEKIKELIIKGADVNVKDDNGWTPLHFASQAFNQEIIKLLLNNHADPNAIDNYGNTPIFRALFNAKGKKTDIFDLFILHGGNPELKNNSGVSAIDLAKNVDNYDLKVYFPKYFNV